MQAQVIFISALFLQFQLLELQEMWSNKQCTVSNLQTAAKNNYFES